MFDTKKYLLGLDAGNTVIKAVLFDLQGSQVASHALDGQSITPHPGYVERDLNELWVNARIAIRRCIENAAINPGQIAAIGCAGHGNGLYMLDRENKPLIGIQSLDSRASDLAEELRKANGEKFHSMCLQEPWFSQTPVLVAWIKENRPELFERVGTIFLCKDFITHKLTDELVSDISDMSGCGLTRMPECRYDDELLELYRITDAKEFLPRLIQPAEIAGKVTAEASSLTGLSEGTPVIGGFFDVIASAIGSGVINVEEASIIAGTWSINQVFSKNPLVNREMFMVSGFAPDRFVNIESSATSAANLEWYVREFVERGKHHDDPFGYCNAKISEVFPSVDDPFFHPYLYGSGQGADYRAGFYGITSWHTEGHMLRALFEGVLFEHRHHIEVLSKSGISFESAVLSGGGARSLIWPQMFADCLGVTILVADSNETGALGAAIGAGVGVGLFDNYEEAVSNMTSVQNTYLPNSDMKSHYDTRYQIYLELIEGMKGFWKATAEYRAK